jgi:hypothetical protein
LNVISSFIEKFTKFGDSNRLRDFASIICKNEHFEQCSNKVAKKSSELKNKCSNKQFEKKGREWETVKEIRRLWKKEKAGKRGTALKGECHKSDIFLKV